MTEKLNGSENLFFSLKIFPTSIDFLLGRLPALQFGQVICSLIISSLMARLHFSQM